MATELKTETEQLDVAAGIAYVLTHLDSSTSPARIMAIVTALASVALVCAYTESWEQVCGGAALTVNTMSQENCAERIVEIYQLVCAERLRRMN